MSAKARRRRRSRKAGHRPSTPHNPWAALAAVLIAIGVQRLGVPTWLVVTLGLVAYYALRDLLRWRPREGRDAQRVRLEGPQRDTAAALLAEGRQAQGRLEGALRRIHDRDTRRQVERLADVADHVLNQLDEEPARTMTVRRFLTFYLPNAAGLAEGWCALEAAARPGPERIVQARTTLAELQDAFEGFADQLVEPELQTLDVDMRVLGDALRQDLKDREPR